MRSVTPLWPPGLLVSTRLGMIDALGSPTFANRRLGDVLIQLGWVAHDPLLNALHLQSLALSQPQSSRPKLLGQLLVQQGLITPHQLHTALVLQMGMPLCDLSEWVPQAEAKSAEAHFVLSETDALPLMKHKDRWVLASSQPVQWSPPKHWPVDWPSPWVVGAVFSHAHVPHDAQDHTPLLETARREALAHATPQPPAERSAMMTTAPVSALSKGSMQPDRVDHFESLSQRLRQTVPDASPTSTDAPLTNDHTLVQWVNALIRHAHEEGASDIHIEPQAHGPVVVRIRRDGQMRPLAELPHALRHAVVSRLKVMADLDIAERRKPQDGKIAFDSQGAGALELRVATLPTAGGVEDAVLRLQRRHALYDLVALGWPDSTTQTLDQVMRSSHGLVICAGPTGSGKTTTLHALLQRLDTASHKVWTAEDPIEITQPGLRQMQVQRGIGLGFAPLLRAMLRADPDVIMVGEVRDAETAQMAIEAALTGHLVLTSLHTHSAVDTLVRLTDLGVDPYAFSDTLKAVVAQRLVRRLCERCKRPDHSQSKPAYGAVGCEACDHTGYRGRVAVHELLVVNPALRRGLQAKWPAAQLQSLADEQGMHRMSDDAQRLLDAGVTSYAEVQHILSDA